jgi:hypothetical protein
MEKEVFKFVLKKVNFTRQSGKKAAVCISCRFHRLPTSTVPLQQYD